METYSSSYWDEETCWDEANLKASSYLGALGEHSEYSRRFFEQADGVECSEVLETGPFAGLQLEHVPRDFLVGLLDERYLHSILGLRR